MEKPKIKRQMVRLGDLKPATYNPANRTSPQAIKKLVDSMDLIGLLSPVTIAQNMTIIDGHRRVASAKSLGWAEIECNVVTLDPSMVYSSVNVTSRSMNGNDALCVWLSCPLAAPVKLIPLFNAMESVLGIDRVKNIAEAGLSLRLFKTAKSITRYCEKDDNALLCKVVDWLLEFPVIGQVMKAMEAGVSPNIILKAVRSGKPVKLSLSVEDN